MKKIDIPNMLSDEHLALYSNGMDYIARRMVDAFLELWPDDIHRLDELFDRLHGEDRFRCLLYLNNLDDDYLAALAPRLQGEVTPDQLRETGRLLRLF